ncbi:hypothetical protein ACJJTC_011037 [Scirpophaga incertulas]
MEGGEGMVAVVRGMRDSALTVTLLDGSTQYTLVPNTVIAPPEHNVFMSHNVASQQTDASEKITCDSGAQVTDGRYASTYKLAHCRVVATSPPVELSEFPPQKAELCRGRSNFEIGGCDSGESHGVSKPNGCRTGISDRGSITSRASREPDAFASSLRQYPRMTIEKSNEILERLICYTQTKSLSRFNRSPSRAVTNRSIRLEYDPDCLRFNNITRNNYQIESETVSNRTNVKNESPTRDINENYTKDNDANIFKIEQCDSTKNTREESSSVNIKVQAAAEMLSKKVVTFRKESQTRENTSALHKLASIDYHTADDEIVHRTIEPDLIFESSQNNCFSDNGNYIRIRNSYIRKKERENPSIEFVQRRKKIKTPFRKLYQNTKMSEIRDKRTYFPLALVFEPNIATNTETKSNRSDIYTNHMANLNKGKNLKEIIVDWLRKLPLKTVEILGTSSQNDEYVGMYAENICSIITRHFKDDTDDSLCKAILNLLSKVPMNIYDCHKIDYLNQEIDSLIRKLKILLNSSDVQSECITGVSNQTLNMHCSEIDMRYTQPKEKQLAELIYNEISQFFGASCKLYSVDFKKTVGAMLTDSLLASMYALRDGKETKVVDEIVQILQKYCLDSNNYLNTFASKLVQCATKIFRSKYLSYSKNYTVLVNTNTNVLNSNSNGKSSHSDSYLKDSITPVTKEDNDLNIDMYINQLSEKIDQWLQDNQIDIPSSDNRDLRLIFIHDLAHDIVDRHKYLEFNPSTRGTAEVELEYLKYFIYKHTNKLLSPEYTDITEYATDLMKKVRSIAEPIFSIPNHKNSTKSNSNQIEYATSNNLNGQKVNTSQSKTENIIVPSCSTGQKEPFVSLSQINEDYDNFLKNWVNEIPIHATTPEERELANMARLGIYNGIWQSIHKLKLNPEIFHNHFYYEDLLENDIDELLNCLPETPELNKNRHIMKVKLIHYTRQSNDRALATAPYRQEVVDVAGHSIRPNNNCESNNLENEEYRKSVAFLDPVGYNEFSRAVPGCSSFNDVHMHSPLRNQSSYIIKDGERVKNPSNVIFPIESTDGSNEYYTIPASIASDPRDHIISVVPENHNTLLNQPAEVLSNKTQNKEVSNRQFSESKASRQIALFDNNKQTLQKENNGPNLNQFPIHFDKIDTQTQLPNTSSISSQYMNQLQFKDGKRIIERKSIGVNVNMPLLLKRPTSPEHRKRLYGSMSTAAKLPENREYTQVQNSFKELNVNPMDYTNITGYDRPQGFPTPRQSNAQTFSPKLNKKHHRSPYRFQQGCARKQLNFDTDVDNDTDKHVRCRCEEILSRRRRRPCYFYRDFDSDDDGCYPCPFFLF